MASDTKERLLEAAWQCVREHGMARSTSRAITDAADANLGAITYYFGSKERLLAEATTAALTRVIRPAMDELNRTDVDPIARVLNAITALQQSFDTSSSDAPAYLDALVHSRTMPALKKELASLFGDLRGVLRRTMAKQKQEGFLPDWVDPAAMAGLLLAVAEGVALHATVDPRGPSHSAMAAQFAQLLIAARGSA